MRQDKNTYPPRKKRSSFGRAVFAENQSFLRVMDWALDGACRLDRKLHRLDWNVFAVACCSMCQNFLLDSFFFLSRIKLVHKSQKVRRREDLPKNETSRWRATQLQNTECTSIIWKQNTRNFSPLIAVSLLRFSYCDRVHFSSPRRHLFEHPVVEDSVLSQETKATCSTMHAACFPPWRWSPRKNLFRLEWTSSLACVHRHVISLPTHTRCSVLL